MIRPFHPSRSPVEPDSTEFSDAIDLSKVTHAAELGPNFISELRGQTEEDFYGSKDDVALSGEWRRREAAAAVQVGAQARFLTGWIHDSSILDIWRSKTTMELIVSDDWTTGLAGHYAQRVANGKALRVNQIMPLRFHFSGVRHLSCHSVDYDDGARLIPEDIDAVFRIAEEYLWTEVVSASATHIQMAMNVWSWKRRRTENAYMVILVEAERLRVYDQRRRAWRRTFGSDRLNVFDEAEHRWMEDARSIVGGKKIEEFLDSMGIPRREELARKKLMKFKTRFRRR